MTQDELLHRLLCIEIAVENSLNLDDKNWLARAFFEIKQLESELVSCYNPPLFDLVDSIQEAEEILHNMETVT